MSIRTALFVLTMSALLVGAAPTRAYAQNTAAGRATVLDGVYTPAQARRGQAQFEQHCAGCHRHDLGGIAGPALKGDRFLDQWREFPLDVLVNDMGTQMPLRNPGGLDASAYLDIAAYLLEANGLPVGRSELTQDVAARVLFVAPGGPRPLPTSAPALIAGCMTKEPGTGWFLTSASEPARTLNPYEFMGAELDVARQTSLGGHVIRLQNLEALPGSTGAADQLVGRKVAAKGILVRHEKGTRLNVATLNAIGDSCER
jgi:S-disulfanyl-L-cysteine oxidoreductase SoxD